MSQPSPSDQAAAARYVEQHAPELDPAAVAGFVAEHAKPTDEPGTPLEWAVRVLRERSGAEAGDGLGVDAVVGELREMRRHDDA